MSGDAPRGTVIVSNPVRLHAHRLAYALQNAGLLQGFYTSIWRKPGMPPAWLRRLLPSRLTRGIDAFLAKRAHDGIDPTKVHQLPIAETGRLLLEIALRGRAREWLLFLQKQSHDRAMARRLGRERPAVFVGYEISCARSFARAHALGALTVLDLAGLDHRFVAGQRRRLGLPQGGSVERALTRQKLRELAQADHIICISGLSRQALIDGGADPARISTINHGVDLSMFHPKREYGTSGPFRLLYVGNISRAKGVDVLIDAFRSLPIPEAELTLVGSRSSRAEEGELDLTGCRHIPFLPHAELAGLYAEADLFILPSLYDSWGMVVSEAMACGTPAIVTGNVGAKELVDGIGWIVEPGSREELAAAIVEAYGNRPSLAERGRGGIARMTNLSWDGYQAQVTELFQVLLAQQKSGAAGD
jgi:glycosyltransferase involved in cell wall biosynthesis